MPTEPSESTIEAIDTLTDTIGDLATDLDRIEKSIKLMNDRSTEIPLNIERIATALEGIAGALKRRAREER